MVDSLCPKCGTSRQVFHLKHGIYHCRRCKHKGARRVFWAEEEKRPSQHWDVPESPSFEGRKLPVRQE